MPDLSERAVLDWWRSLPGLDGQNAAPLRPVEHGGAITPRLEELGALLDRAASREPSALSRRLRQQPLDSALRTALAQLGPARVLRLLHWLAETDLPESHAIAQHLTGGADPAAATIRALVDVTARRSTLRATLDPDRLEAVQQTLEEPER